MRSVGGSPGFAGAGRNAVSLPRCLGVLSRWLLGQPSRQHSRRGHSTLLQLHRSAGVGVGRQFERVTPTPAELFRFRLGASVPGAGVLLLGKAQPPAIALCSPPSGGGDGADRAANAGVKKGPPPDGGLVWFVSPPVLWFVVCPPLPRASSGGQREPVLIRRSAGLAPAPFRHRG